MFRICNGGIGRRKGRRLAFVFGEGMIRPMKLRLDGEADILAMIYEATVFDEAEAQAGLRDIVSHGLLLMTLLTGY